MKSPFPFGSVIEPVFLHPSSVKVIWSGSAVAARVAAEDFCGAHPRVESPEADAVRARPTPSAPRAKATRRPPLDVRPSLELGVRRESRFMSILSSPGCAVAEHALYAAQLGPPIDSCRIAR